MHAERLFETALGMDAPWYVREARFDLSARNLTIHIDFRAGSRFRHPGGCGEHPVHDTQIKRYRHLNFFQHECFLEVRLPRVKLPGGSVRLVEPPWVGTLSGFTLLFEAWVLCLCREMPFAAVERLVGESRHGVAAVAERYVDLVVVQADYSAVRELAIDETSKARGHSDITVAADAKRRAVIFVTYSREAVAMERLAEDLVAHGADPLAIASVSLDMSPAYIKGISEHFPNEILTYDKFHVIAQRFEGVGCDPAYGAEAIPPTHGKNCRLDKKPHDQRFPGGAPWPFSG